jgi:AraC-like DNA-binding protein
LRIAALVHPVLKGRIREALAPGDLFLDARSWDDLSEIAATRQVDLAVIDPAAFGQSAIAAAADFASTFPVLPILVYTVASPTTAETLMKLRAHGVSHALLHPYEGPPATVRKKLQHARQDHLVEHFLDRLSGPLELLPSPLQSTIRRMFANPEQFSAASDLALGAGLPLSGVYRALHTAGLGSPKKLFIVARLLNAYSRLGHSEDSVKCVAQRLGYANPRVLGLHSRAALAVTPRRLRNVSQRVLTEKLYAWIALPPRSNAEITIPEIPCVSDRIWTKR